MAGNELAILIKATDMASGPMRAVASSLGTIGDAADAQSKRLGGFGDALGNVGKVAAGAGLVIGGGLVAGLAVATKSAADFQAQVSGIAAVGGADAVARMGEIQAKALQVGKDTAFSASEAAAGMEELVKAGVSISDVLGGATDATVALAAATGVDLATSAEIAANAMNQFNLKGEELGSIADIVAGAANASSIDVNDFKYSLASVGAVANTVGFSFKDTAVAIAAMGQAGIKGSDAGTSLKTMFMSLQPQSNKQAGLFRDLGLLTEETGNAFFDLQGNVKPMREVFGTLNNALANFTKEQKLAYLETIFGSDAVRAGAIAAELGAQGFDDMAAAMDKVSAADVAKTRLDNLNGSMEALKGSLETAGITIGLALLPALKSIVDGATGLLNTAMPAIEGFANGTAEVFVIAQDALSGFALIVQQAMTGDVASAFENLGTMMEVVGLRINDILGEWAASFLAWIGPMVGPMLQQLANLYAQFASWMTMVALPGLIEKLGEWAAAFIDWVGPQIPGLLRELGTLLVQIGSWMLGTALPALVGNLVKWGLAFIEWVAPKIPMLIIEVAKLNMELCRWIVTTAVSEIIKHLLEWGAAFVDWVTKPLQELPGKLAMLLNVISEWVTSSLNNVATEAGKLGAGFVQGIQDGIGGALNGLKTWVTENLANALPEWVRDVLGIHSPSSVFADIGSNMIAGLQKGILSSWPDVETVVQNLMGRFRGLGGEVPGSAGDWLRTALAITGTPSDWFDDLYELMKMESGGDPTAQNPTHVIRDGVDYGQATGLMQMLPGTFASHMLEGFNNIWNPIDNAVSAIRYIADEYGSVHNINRSPEGGYLGYEKGGYVPRTGPANLHEGEYVLPAAMTQRIMGGGGGGGITVVVNVGGSVTTENDLVECIRRGLIQTARRNGYSALGGLA